MNTKLVAFLLLALAMSWSAIVSADEATENDAEEVAAEVVEESSEPLASGIGWQLIRSVELGKSGKFVNMVLIERGRQADKTIYSAALNRLCREEKEFCRVRFWVQERFIPEKASMTTEQNQHLLADHLFNREAGIHRIQYACSVDPTSSECIAH
ncbi:MAG: hypothetical protein OEX82_02440 [Nitrosomonas sp.]|nr:hypothetical protein [Nitrosomonas sp.]